MEIEEAQTQRPQPTTPIPGLRVRIRTFGSGLSSEPFFYTAPEPGDTKPPREPEPDFDDRQRQVYRAPSQAGPGNDIYAGSPSLQKAPTRGSASLARFFSKSSFKLPPINPCATHPPLRRMRWPHPLLPLVEQRRTGTFDSSDPHRPIYCQRTAATPTKPTFVSSYALLRRAVL